MLWINQIGRSLMKRCLTSRPAYIYMGEEEEEAKKQEKSGNWLFVCVYPKKIC
jgi:hypothetical protein